MTRWRIAIAVPGLLLLAYGVMRLVTNLAVGDLVSLALWLVVAAVLHDAVIAPLTVGVGVLLTRVPPRARRYAQGGLIVAALVTVVAVPLIARRGSQPEQKALLLRDYAGNLAILLGLIAAVTLVLYVVRVVRAGGQATSTETLDG